MAPPNYYKLELVTHNCVLNPKHARGILFAQLYSQPHVLLVSYCHIPIWPNLTNLKQITVHLSFWGSGNQVTVQVRYRLRKYLGTPYEFTWLLVEWLFLFGSWQEATLNINGLVALVSLKFWVLHGYFIEVSRRKRTSSKNGGQS